ncbi:MAG: N-glycosyltransferase [Parcubacteria group bacterium ADurb.Bin316]|nr:MAG: N-glycosyltransferase [Parcubacteria group bacterium ADurb.Bin316]HOZ55872.1 glycosyltransferase family 2 protein [bacterium]
MKLAIGIILYEDFTAKYLPYFLQSLKKQTWQDFELLVFDNGEKLEDSNIAVVNEYFPNVKWQGVKKNLGFARAYNFLIREAKDAGAEYFLAINPDVILEPDVLELLVKEIGGNQELGSVCPKIMQWNFAKNQKTNIIDSGGIKLKSGLRFFDVGQGEVDHGQFDNTEILGPSGAASLYRLSALEKAKEDNQYFDELMFMYKEDCDLAYRLQLAGFKSKCVANALVYHDRTAQGKGESDSKIIKARLFKSRQVKEWSFLHQQIIFIKYWHILNFAEKLNAVIYELKMIIFVLLFEQHLLKQFSELKKIKNKIKIYKKPFEF